MGKSNPKQKGAPLGRKELRKAMKEKEKLKRQEHHTKTHQKKVESTKPGSLMQAAAKIKAKPLTEKPVSKEAPKSSTVSASKSAYKDPLIEKEDAEIARLGKLLGINKGKSKKSISSKLNKEFELYEGISGGFGDFLNDLDELTEMIEEDEQDDHYASDKKSNKRKRIFVDNDSDEDQPEEHFGKGHIIDDDEQERSDIDESVDEDMYDSEEGSEEEEEGSGDENESEQENDYGDSENEDEGDDDGSEAPDLVDVGNDDDDEDNNSDENGSDDDQQDDSKGSNSDNEENSENDNDNESEEESQQKSNDLFTYRPTKGEDIYGRQVDTAADSGDAPKKYIPPAKRKEILSKIDEQSDAVRMVRKQLNSLMNKLSDQSKDAIARSIKQVFSSNSVSVCSLVLKDCILAACANPTQLMTSLIPIYAAVVAALHFSIGADVGAFIIESLSVTLHQSVAAAANTQISPSALINNKLPNNALLLLVYLYNLRVVHHTLIVDIMNSLAGVTDNNNSNIVKSHLELRAELLECVINHCGTSIRSDDPVSLKTVINTLSKLLKTINEDPSSEAYENSRMKFMFEALTDLKNNKSRRIQQDNAEVVKNLRKWLGTIKNSMGATRTGGADLCLRVTLKDLLDAEKRGRWWKAGASWTGKDTSAEETTVKIPTRNVVQAVNEEEEKLLKLATKLKMNTSTRRNIFVVLMSSRDVTDAFERLQRLELKGKQDREIVRVITECCGQEKSYNPFYFELAKVLCLQNRQYKTTFQFAFWDFLKQFHTSDDDEITVSTRRIVNLGRLLAQLICSYQIPLTSIKAIEMSNLNSKLILFLSTFYLALFKEPIPDEDFQNIVDRVATTKDFATVRDNILFFLQRYMEKLPPGLDPSDAKKIQKRRKMTIKTMEAMTVLDISKGMMDPDEVD